MHTMHTTTTLSPTDIADSPLTTNRSRIDSLKVEELSTRAVSLSTQRAELAREEERLSTEGAHAARLLKSFTLGGVRHAADAAGLSEKRMATIVNGSAQPNPDEVRSICKALAEIAGPTA